MPRRNTLSDPGRVAEAVAELLALGEAWRDAVTEYQTAERLLERRRTSRAREVERRTGLSPADLVWAPKHTAYATRPRSRKGLDTVTRYLAYRKKVVAINEQFGPRVAAAEARHEAARIRLRDVAIQAHATWTGPAAERWTGMSNRRLGWLVKSLST